MAVVCVCKAFAFFFWVAPCQKKGKWRRKRVQEQDWSGWHVAMRQGRPSCHDINYLSWSWNEHFLKRVQLLGWNSTTEMTNTIYGWVKEKKRMFCVLLYSQVLIAKHIAAGLHSRTVKVSTIKRPMQRWRTNSKLPSWTLTYCRLGRKLCNFFFSEIEFFKPFMKMMSTFEQRGLAFFRMAFGGLMVVYSMRMIRYHHLALNQQSDGETWTIPHIP